jgi:hypothetical protein
MSLGDPTTPPPLSSVTVNMFEGEEPMNFCLIMKVVGCQHGYSIFKIKSHLFCRSCILCPLKPPTTLVTITKYHMLDEDCLPVVKQSTLHQREMIGNYAGDLMRIWEGNKLDWYEDMEREMKKLKAT